MQYMCSEVELWMDILLKLYREAFMNKKIRNLILICLCFSIILSFTSNKASANTTNKAWSVEYFAYWWHYDGTAQFVPSALMPKNPGYYLTPGKQVKQAYVNYTRKKNGEDTSIIGGRKYTRVATSKTTNAIYSVKATAKDSLNIFTNQTQFWYGWIYF